MVSTIEESRLLIYSRFRYNSLRLDVYIGIADPGCVCVIGGDSSFSGTSNSSSGDYLCIAQAKKPIIQIWAWGKPQVHMQCHIQEVATSIACDYSGSYIFAGTKKGWIFCWEVSSGRLLLSWQAHFKEVTRLKFTSTNDFCISCSGDGIARAWDMAVLDDSESHLLGEKKSISPYRCVCVDSA